jgi:Fe-S cluster assembly iron-binding protein IscA
MCPSTSAAAPSAEPVSPSPSSAVDFYAYRTEVADVAASKYRPANVSVSQRCYENIKRVNRLEGLTCSDRFLRLSIESGGCQGFSYKFDFDTEVSDAKGRAKTRAAGGEVEEAEEDDVADIRFYPPVVTSDSASVSAAQEEQEKNVPFVVVDTETLKKLQGATLDYHSELKGSAFVVIGNELVDHSCACAMSFAIKSPAK